MIKRIGRRFVSLLLTFVTILTMLPAMTLPALAATSGNFNLTDMSIGLSFKSDVDDVWRIKNANVIGQVKSGKDTSCQPIYYSATLTITNKKATAATLSFDYTIDLNDGTIKVGGTNVTAGGKFSSKLQAGEEVKVEITSGSTDNPTTITISNIKLIADVNATVTFLPAENGSYTVDGKPFTEKSPNTQYAMIPYQVVATPNEGYRFRDWYNVTTGKTISKEKSCALNVEENCEITARFVSANTATFLVGSETFIALDEATEYAKANTINQITLDKEGTLLQGDYTIPSGVTLLIPFNEDKTVYREKPDYVGAPETQTAYKTLTMPSGSSIEVYGEISVGGKHFAGSFGSCCKATGRYGQIIMQEGSSITLNEGANLYAWGYITGDGKITATSGSTVYEYFQVTDWRGGTATLKMNGNDQKVFPFSQYYVQNIEAPLTIQHGATEKAYFSVNVQKITIPTTIDFIGTKGLFQLQSGSITKKYVPATGRTEYTTNGTASLEHLAVEMKLGIIPYTIDSQDYALPINGNMTLNIASGKVTSNFDLCLLPGVQINIAKDAELEVAGTASLYVYGSAEWGDYCQCKNKKIADVDYSPTLDRRVRTVDDLVDAKIDLNGKLTAIGSVYTTQSGANICSSEGGGRYVQQSAPGTNKTTHQATQNDKSISYADIPITPAQLKNKDGSYTKTSTASASDTFTYCKCQECGGGKWVKNLKVAAINNNDGTQVTTHETLQEAVDRFSQDSSGNTYIKMLHSTTEEINAQSDLYLDLHGCTVTGNFTMNSKTLYGMDSATNKYDGTNAGKIVGSVAPYAKTTYQTPTVTPVDPDDDAYKRYVAIQGKEGTTSTLSFHRFNISVTGYRFELTSGDTPKCALFFIGKFRGDDAAKKHLKSLGFTLTGGNGTGPKEFSCEMPQARGNEVFPDKDGAFLFEVYLKRSFGKDASAASFTEGISATAKATFQNQGVLGEQLSNERTLSFKEAWEKADNLDPAQKAIIDKILREHGINQ